MRGTERGSVFAIFYADGSITLMPKEATLDHLRKALDAVNRARPENHATGGAVIYTVLERFEEAELT